MLPMPVSCNPIVPVGISRWAGSNQEAVKELEAKRKVKAAAYYQLKKKQIILRARRQHQWPRQREASSGEGSSCACHRCCSMFCHVVGSRQPPHAAQGGVDMGQQRRWCTCAAWCCCAATVCHH